MAIQNALLLVAVAGGAGAWVGLMVPAGEAAAVPTPLAFAPFAAAGALAGTALWASARAATGASRTLLRALFGTVVLGTGAAVVAAGTIHLPALVGAGAAVVGGVLGAALARSAPDHALLVLTWNLTIALYLSGAVSLALAVDGQALVPAVLGVLVATVAMVVLHRTLVAERAHDYSGGQGVVS